MIAAWTQARREHVSLAAKKSNAARSLRAWPVHKVETLRFLVEAGMHSFEQIGRKMGITKNAAIGKARRLNLAGPRMTGPKGDEPTTLLSRLDALHAAFDAARPPDPPRLKPAKDTDNATRPMLRARV